MGKTLADAMTAQPGPDSLAYWLAPLQGYWDRQGRMAQQGLQMAEQGAQAVRGGDMSGLAGVLLGPAQYLGSPVSALFPERSEVEAATDVPAWSKPFIAGGLETMAILAPGPGGKAKGLGRGLNELTDAATDAERVALASRLQGEAVQTGGQASAVTRDQALRNLTETPESVADEYRQWAKREGGTIHDAVAAIRDEASAWPKELYEEAATILERESVPEFYNQSRTPLYNRISAEQKAKGRKPK